AAPPVGLLARAGFRALSLDATLLAEADDDAVAAAVEAGVALLLGLVPTTSPLPAGPAGPAGPDAGREVAAAARALWRRTGLASELLGTVAVTPTCGLAGSSQGEA